ncbi:MAG: transposase [Candidatus Marinimicrobia bacterium]|nr:transposase [Candidatus Neomarinimicrobiota bacterium]
MQKKRKESKLHRHNLEERRRILAGTRRRKKAKLHQHTAAERRRIRDRERRRGRKGKDGYTRKVDNTMKGFGETDFKKKVIRINKSKKKNKRKGEILDTIVHEEQHRIHPGMKEKNIKKTLTPFTQRYRVGRWLQSICGIGPVLSAGLIAHLDVRNRPTAGHFWRFAGLDPTVVWSKGERRPWNAKLKTLCYKIGESFVKTQSRATDYYGKLFRERKDQEIKKNDLKEFSDQADARVSTVSKSTDAYKFYSIGLLPPAHIHARARRWVVKIFLSHLHHVMYVDAYGVEPPVPYVFEKCPGDHSHFIALPNWPFEGGGEQLYVA